MAGNVCPESAPRSRYIPGGHPLAWWMLVVTTGDILITSIDRALLPTVLLGILQEFNLSETAGGVLVGLSFAAPVAGFIVQHYGFTWHYISLAVICLLTLVPISLIRETSAGQEESAVPQGA